MTAALFKRLWLLLRFLAGVVLVFFGSLELFAGFWGQAPIWVTSHTYFRVVPASSASATYSIVFGCVAIGLGALLLAKSLFRRRVS